MAGWGNVKTELTNVREKLASTDVPDNTVNAPSANRDVPSGATNKSTERSKGNPAKEPTETSNNRTIATIVEGAQRGGVEAAKTLPNDRAPVTTQEAIVRSISDTVAPAYFRKLLQENGLDPDTSLLRKFGYDIAVLMFISLNGEILSSSQNAINIFNASKKRISELMPFAGSWRTFVPDQILQAIDSFNNTTQNETTNQMSLEQVKVILTNAAKQGIVNAKTFANTESISETTEHDILREINGKTAKVLTDAGVIDGGVKAKAIGENIAFLMVMATNPRAFSSTQAKDAFHQRRLALPTDWTQLVERQVADAIRYFKTVSYGPTSQKQEIQEAFLRGANDHVVAQIENIRRQEGLPDKNIELEDIYNEFKSVADLYYVSAKKMAKSPTIKQATEIGEIFYALMLIYAYGKDDIPEYISNHYEYELNSRWPGWLATIQRVKGWDNGGVIEKITTGTTIAYDRYKTQMSRSQYQNLFYQTYEKLSKKIKEASCQPINAKPCIALTQVQNAIASDKLVLAKPMDIQKLLGESTKAEMFISSAQMVVSTVVQSLGNSETYNTDTLSRMSQDLISHIAMGGKSSIDPTVEHVMWHKFDDPKSEWQQEDDQKKAKAEEFAKEVNLWGQPTTIMFGSLVLWWLARGINGIPID
jgi:hypothetical protein